jgi:hypothetical protein
MSMTDGYPFIFQMNDYSVKDNLLEFALQYRFKSTKSNHTYIVRVERYVEHTYCLKFFDKANMLSDNKFSLRTGTFEPRTIFFTLLHIMMDVYHRDSRASFFFIGAEDEKDEMGEATRRYRIYRSFVSSVLSSKIFKHHRNNELSLYILVNRAAVVDEQKYVQRITDEVKSAMQ